MIDSPKAPRRATRALHPGFLDQNTLVIRYQDEQSRITVREIKPHYLLLNYPIWYVVAFDQLSEAVRMLRCDRIQSTRKMALTSVRAGVFEGLYRLEQPVDGQIFVQK